MSNKAARNLFIFGSIFFFVIFIGLTIDTMKRVDKRAPEITADVDAGKQVWHKYDCIGCHTILGNGSYFAPDMTKVVERKPKDYLKRFLMDPKSVNPKASMPKLGLSSDETDKLIAFLDWISKVDTNNWPPKPILAGAAVAAGKPASEGAALYQRLGCSNCHRISGIGGTSGPDLTNIGARQSKAWLFEFLKNPAKVRPGSAMPAVKAADAEIEALTDYLVTLR